MIRSRRKSENIPKEHFLAVHQVVETETAGLARIGDDIAIRCEYAVRVAPGGHLFEAKFLQPVLFDDFFQIGPLSTIDRARLMCRGGANSIPKKLANLGHRFCHLMRSLLVMLKAWLAHFGSVAIHSTAFAKRAASVLW